MKPFRVGRWGSNILPPLVGPRPYSPLSRRIVGYSSCLAGVRFESTFELLGKVPADEASVKRKRGRPRKAAISTSVQGSSVAASPPASISSSSSQSSSSSNPRSSLSAPRSQNTTASSSSSSQSILEPVSAPPSEILPETPMAADSPSRFSQSTHNQAVSHSIEPSQSTLLEAEVLSLGKGSQTKKQPTERIEVPLEQLPSPPVSAAARSAKLSALHARLGLSSKIPVETLARTLVDNTADTNSKYNNRSLSILGNDFLKYYMTEHMICKFPRLPSAVLSAAIAAYIGPAALSAIAQEWGIEVTAEPGGEVDPGLLQFRRVDVADELSDMKLHGLDKAYSPPEMALESGKPWESKVAPRTLEDASARFVQALVGAIYLHCGSQAIHGFFASHVLSRQLDVSSLFTFRKPERDLARLCAREGFEAPIARLLSETGRLSRSPVYIVGVFSGRDKLGEGSGASLLEARARASIKALKGWYLYSPVAGTAAVDIPVPSMTERPSSTSSSKPPAWKPAMIDIGEVFV